MCTKFYVREILSFVNRVLYIIIMFMSIKSTTTILGIDVVVDGVISRIALLQFVSRRWRHLANGRRPGHAGKVNRPLCVLDFSSDGQLHLGKYTIYNNGVRIEQTKTPRYNEF